MQSITGFPKNMQSSTDFPKLIIQTESGDYRLALVDRKYWTIGRGKNNLIVLSDIWVSREHAVLYFTESGHFVLVDLDSLNGSYVNQQAVTDPVILHNGDLLTLGKTRIEFCSTEIQEELASTSLLTSTAIEFEDEPPTFGNTEVSIP
jgi:pSer/pThr/pTyr-binding forkhead associated (FHA) protein